MSDITGSVNVGDGFSIAYDLNPSTSNPELTLSLEYLGSIKVASATLTENDASATFGGSVSGTDLTAEATTTFDFSDDKLSYSVLVTAPGIPHEEKKTYSGSTTI